MKMTRLFLVALAWLPAISSAQYTDAYYEKYLPMISSDAKAFSTVGAIASKLPPDVQAIFRRHFLAMSLQHPVNPDCSLPANLAGVERFEKKRSDGLNAVLTICKEQMLFTTESVATIFLVMMSLDNTDPGAVDRIMLSAIKKNVETATSLFSTYRRRSTAFSCIPPYRAYVQRREENDATCFGANSGAVGTYMASRIRIGLKYFLPQDYLEISDTELYFGFSEFMSITIAKVLITFTLLHEIGHIVNGDLNADALPDEASEINADQFAIKYINRYFDNDEQILTLIVLILAQLHMSSVNIAWLHSEEGQNINEIQQRVQVAQQAANCLLKKVVQDPSLPPQMKTYFANLQRQPQYRCQQKP